MRRFDRTVREHFETRSALALRSAAVLVAALASNLVACGNNAAVTEDSALTNSSLGRNDILKRAKSWIDEKVPYSQGATHTNKYGTYRTDCSGYVSMAWKLDTSLTTWSLPNVSKTVDSDDLEPGDALIKNSDGTNHAALFVRWAGSGKTAPVVWEEYTDGHPAEERTWDSLRGYTGYRNNDVTGKASAVSKITSDEDSDDEVSVEEPTDDETPSSVKVSWPTVSGREYSLDVRLKNGDLIGPCVAVDIIGTTNHFKFDGECISPSITVEMGDVDAFQICSVRTGGNWKTQAKCTDASWNGHSKSVKIKH